MVARMAVVWGPMKVLLSVIVTARELELESGPATAGEMAPMTAEALAPA